MDPRVHAVRVSHWQRVVSGKLGSGFQESAEALASAFYDNGVPGYAVAICHASVTSAIVRELGLDIVPSAGRILGRSSGAKGAALRTVLNKLAWLDLEVMLETYAQAEQASRAEALREMAEAIEREAGAAVEKVSSLTACWCWDRRIERRRVGSGGGEPSFEGGPPCRSRATPTADTIFQPSSTG
ncbi:protoglobin domain-containing protein [Paracraurococcus lichenis]|uniref:Protoglobin domain-containing protein n=1 Tax=Paracraurococcus lichenis TaxID=3064888 RepID=A0ABT9EC65_9PROT|nr:protoglobin domain-containing protein [Paracraurococcus sp. LOR1-02]MDO9713699.1 protoglobin domain-containing protein [Paracraurococcus sp. LOR1-02]